MSEYMTRIDGSSSLAEIAKSIAGEEALAAKFVRSQLAALDGEITNVVTFVEVDDVPAEIRIELGTGAPPAGFTRQWSGVMLVEGRNMVVTLYRKND